VSAPALLLVLGDEELLATRAVAEVVEAARNEDTLATINEFQGGDLLPGELAAALSPSLFGGRRRKTW
jgi:DNA polymerase III subunit delta